MSFFQQLTEELKALFKENPSFLPEFLKNRALVEKNSIRSILRQGQTPEQDNAALSFNEAFNQRYGELNIDKQNEIASKLANILLRTVLFPTLAENIAKERLGFNPNVESMLRSVLEMNGITINQDLLFGREMPLEIRKNLEKLGMSPESEDNLMAFLNSLGISDIARPDTVSSQALEEGFKERYQTAKTLAKNK
jgi:hypothetical protein